EVAFIDHLARDRVAAGALVLAAPAAVVNASASISGRYPNVGPLLLAAANIPLVDGVGDELMDAVGDGDVVVIDGDYVRAGTWEGRGTRQTMATLEAIVAAARETLGHELERFAENTLEYLRREQH